MLEVLGVPPTWFLQSWKRRLDGAVKIWLFVG